MTDFKPGDRVTHRTWGPGEIEYGPYNVNMYLVKFDSDGLAKPVSPGTFEPVSTDPRREVVARAHIEQQSDGQHDSNGDSPDRSMSADAPARYRDRDGDVWEEMLDGTHLIVETSRGVARTPLHTRDGRSYRDLEFSYGPLTRV
jgi:hypothetical protein